MSVCMSENIWSQNGFRDFPVGSPINCKGHLGGDRLGPKQVGNLLLRAANSVSQLGLRTKEANSGFDMGANLHTSFLVEIADDCNKETCLARHKGAGIIPPNMSIASNLAALRNKAGLSQTGLAKKAGLSQQLISQIENGVNRGTTKLPLLAKALGCSVEDIDPDYFVISDDATKADVVDRFKAILTLDNEDALRSVDDHLRFVLHRYKAEPDDKIEEDQ